MKLYSGIHFTVWLMSCTLIYGRIYRELLKSGMHRDLFTQFDIHKDELEINDNEVECSVLFIEMIPSGAYVDPYQLASLRPFGGPDFYLKDTVDLEQAEFLSKPFKLYIYSNLTRLDNDWTCQYTLPVHLRYHAVSSSKEFDQVEFVNPEVALKCLHKTTKMDYQAYKGRSVREIKEHCSSSSKWLCDWTQLYTETDKESLLVNMPVGREEHFVIVTMGTILATVLGCIFLIYKTIFSHVKYKES